MGILEKILNPFAGEVPAEKGDDASAITDIGILEESVRDIILDAVAPFTGEDRFTGLTLWVNDQFYQVLDREPFIASLRASFDSMRLRALGSGEIKVVHGEPLPQDEASPLFRKHKIPAGKIWIRLREQGAVTEKHAKAAIKVVNGLGSCLEPEYVLDANQKTLFRMGRGAVCRKPGEAFRTNDIVIEEDNPDAEVQKLNNFVSRAQADILLEDGAFFLKAMPSGCRMTGGSPTKIIHGGQLIELRDPHSAYRLHDGDFIELGKSVLLQFRIIE